MDVLPAPKVSVPVVATGEDIRAFYANVSAGWAQTARTVTCLAAIGLVWFVVVLPAVLVSLLVGFIVADLGIRYVFLAFAVIAADFLHHGLVEPRIELLADHLPHRYRVAKGIIIDADGRETGDQRSGQGGSPMTVRRG